MCFAAHAPPAPPRVSYQFTVCGRSYIILYGKLAGIRPPYAPT